MYEFKYHRPASLDEAKALLSNDEEALAISGGQTLLPVLRARLSMPTALIDLGNVEDMRGVSLEGDRP